MFSNHYESSINSVTIYTLINSIVISSCSLFFDKSQNKIKTLMWGSSLTLALSCILWAQIAGIPPMPSFFIKYYIIESSLKSGQIVVVNILVMAVLNVVLILMFYRSLVINGYINQKLDFKKTWESSNYNLCFLLALFTTSTASVFLTNFII